MLFFSEGPMYKWLRLQVLPFRSREAQKAEKEEKAI